MLSTDLKLLRIASLVTAYLAAWLAARPYEGITHDAQAYVLQALARLHPESLGGDMFLRFGSQNDFTIFPWLVAALIRAIGVEPAALAVTMISGVALLVAGGVLARRLSDPRCAWLAVGLLITIPGWYGAGGVFRYDEMSLNARVPCEVLCVFALAAVVQDRRWLALVLCALAATVHPLMALPACVAVALIVFCRTGRPRALFHGATIILIGAAVACLALGILGPSAGPDRAAWLETLRARNAFLFFSNWKVEDWLQNALGFATLAIAATTLVSRDARRFAMCAMFVGALGMLIAWIATTGQRFDLLLLAQSWRWSWLTRFLAIVLLPATLASLWQRDAPGRAVALLMASGWALHGYFGGAWLLVAAMIWLVRDHVPATTWRTLLPLAGIVAGLSLAWLAVLAVQASPLVLDTNLGPRWAQRIINVAGAAGPLVLVVTLCGYVTLVARSAAVVALLLMCSIAGLVGASLYNYARVSEPRYSLTRYRAFAPWRTEIAPNAEVLWHQDPVACWVLLERRSYLSGSQTAGLLYSRRGIAEFDRRRRVLAPLASPGWWTLAARGPQDEPRALTMPLLRHICRDLALGYVVDEHALGSQVASAEWPTRGQRVYLYDCSLLRSGQS
jgi:hypothetical protein